MSNYMDYLARRVGYESYNQYLHSEHWIFFSDAIRRNKCFCCGSVTNLAIHHTTYERLGSELPTDVITVCNGCHKSIHNLVKKGVGLGNAHYKLITRRKGKGKKHKKHKRKKRTKICLECRKSQAKWFYPYCGPCIRKILEEDNVDKQLIEKFVARRKSGYEKPQETQKSTLHQRPTATQ